MTILRVAILALAALFHSFQCADCFQARAVAGSRTTRLLSGSRAFMSNMDDSRGAAGAPEYSRDIILREEAESPFRKVRFFAYASLGVAALTSLLISMARVAAALSGINPDLLAESSLNAGVDLAGIAVIGVLWQRDLKAQDSRLKRAAKGAELAKLMVRGSKAMMEGYVDSTATLAGSGDVSKKTSADSFTTTLASMRRGRGIEKRVVIAAGSKEKIASVVKEAIDLQESLIYNDLLIVPVVVPQCGAPTDVDPNELPSCLALPVGLSSWKVVVGDELEEALKQGIDVANEGFCIILKKNGRVGQRTRGIFLRNLAGNVEARREAGMDVKNI